MFASVLVAGAASGTLPGTDRKSGPGTARSAVPAGQQAR
ncbi:peptidase S41, partial [Streptomyces sp. SID5926]|nr:peptidase S41 [Streptomyces sp. SID5926]